MKYNPERWMVITQTLENGETFQRVFAGWYGGYLGSDSWKLSSRINRVKEFKKTIRFYNESGSTYICYKAAYGSTGLMGAVFDSLVKQGFKIEVAKEYSDRQDEFLNHKKVKEITQ